MLYKVLSMLIAATVAVAPSALAGGETYGYTASAGVNVLGVGAASNNAVFGPGSFTSSVPVNAVSVDVLDDSGSTPYVTVCVDVNSNGLCSTNDGDIQSFGLGGASVSSASSFTTISVFVYTLFVDADGSAYTGTTGTLTVQWG